MKLSRPVDYALRACVDLALHDGQLTEVRNIAARQGVPQPYLAKIVQQLARAGILSTTRGAHGGVRLTVPPEQLTVLRVFEAIEGPTSFSKCELFPGECPDQADCPYHDMLAGLSDTMRSYLQSVTIGDMAKKAAGARRRHQAAVPPNA